MQLYPPAMHDSLTPVTYDHSYRWPCRSSHVWPWYNVKVKNSHSWESYNDYWLISPMGISLKCFLFPSLSLSYVIVSIIIHIFVLQSLTTIMKQNWKAHKLWEEHLREEQELWRPGLASAGRTRGLRMNPKFILPRLGWFCKDLPSDLRTQYTVLIEALDMKQMKLANMGDHAEGTKGMGEFDPLNEFSANHVANHVGMWGYKPVSIQFQLEHVEINGCNPQDPQPPGPIEKILYYSCEDSRRFSS